MDQLPEIGRRVRFNIPEPTDVESARLHNETGTVIEHTTNVFSGKPLSATITLDNPVKGHYSGTAWGTAAEFEYVDE